MVREQIFGFVEQNRAAIVETLRQLVQAPSVNPYSGDREPSGEEPGQMRLREMLSDLPGRLELFDCPDDIYKRMGVLGPEDRNFRGRPNLVLTIDLPNPGPTVIVNGHMDTVGVDNMAIEPFAAEVKDGKVWGRGTSDCKGGITCAVWAIRALLPLSDRLGGRIIFESVVDEECNGSGAGTLACIDRGLTGDAAIFVDGKDCSVVHGCYGCLTAAVEVEGREGHAAYGTGVSALEKAILVKQAIDQFKARREQRYRDARVNIGVFRAGTHPAVVPGRAEMQMNIVYHLEEAQEAKEQGLGWGAELVRRELARAIEEAAVADEWLKEHPPRLWWIKDLVPFLEPADSELVQRACRAVEEACGGQPEKMVMLGWTDAAYYSALAGVPTVLMGPATADKPHTPDESVEIEALVRTTAALAILLADLLARR